MESLKANEHKYHLYIIGQTTVRLQNHAEIFSAINCCGDLQGTSHSSAVLKPLRVVPFPLDSKWQRADMTYPASHPRSGKTGNWPSL